MATLKRTVLAGFPAESNRLKRTLYIGGLDDNVDKTILHAAFIPFGELRTVEIPKDRATGKSWFSHIPSFKPFRLVGASIDKGNIGVLVSLNSKRKTMLAMQLII